MGSSEEKGTCTSACVAPLPPSLHVDAWVSDPKEFALCLPSLVSHSILCLLARMPAVHVLPLFPPQPTSIRPSFGVLRCVRNWYSTFLGTATALPLRICTSVDSYWYVDSM